MNHSAFGFSPQSHLSGSVRDCAERNDQLRIAPITRSNIRDPYRADHGTLVSVLAAGGIQIAKETPDLSSLLGISMARISMEPWADDGFVRAPVATLIDAVKFATASDIHVINASIRVENSDAEGDLRKALNEYPGLVIAAAGNTGLPLGPSQVFPGGASLSLRDNRKILVVGAVDWRNGTFESHNESTYSSSLVDIAAPGVDIPTTSDGEEIVCISGTSAAAPLVSFTAGVVRSFGITSPENIRRRILTTADYFPQLEERINSGRVLNVASAVDIFADLVWLNSMQGNSPPIRGKIVFSDGNAYRSAGFLLVCGKNESLLKATGGYVDLGVLDMWRRVSVEGREPSAEVWKRRGIRPDSEVDQYCEIPKDTGFMFLKDGEDEPIQFDFSEVWKVVPSPFRESW